MNYRHDDTIAALATAPGKGAVAIIRLSGPQSLPIAERLTGISPSPREAHVCSFRDEDGDAIDRGLLLFFPGPRSFTGEDVIELHGHGGAVVSDMLFACTLRFGARAAEPGEFSLRAFLNDKLDLLQAEGIADLVDSGSAKAARAAYRSLDGRFSDQVRAVQKQLTALRVQLEAWLDFPDEELELNDTSDFEKDFDLAIAALEVLLTQAREGAVLSNGITVVIAGPPNAGKSSLLNRLSGYDAAIVTSAPGTTRDALRERLSLDGLPLLVVDTAGLRESEDPIELEGMRRAYRAAESADRLIWVTDVRIELAAQLERIHDMAGEGVAVTVVQNKVDLVDEDAKRYEQDGISVIRMSALTGVGLELLTDHLKSIAGYHADASGTFSARTRHIEAMKRAEHYIRDARLQLVNTLALELAAEELRSAQRALDEVTGEVTSDDLLGEIFSSFCIGK
ncbi:MAG: tRNA uridine-5-carboxymethylaminomethyl(34) synthesis GTPase MnmE [Candidatus Rariloculaceae bacterium]